MMFAGEVPWHLLGQNAGKDPVDGETAQRLSYLTSPVAMRPLYSFHGDTFDQVPNNVGRAIVRVEDGKVLGISGRVYEPVQNHELFEFCESIGDVADGRVRFETAGSLRGGTHVWALGRFQDGFEPILGDRHNKFVWASNVHNGKESMYVANVTERVVCANTWRAAAAEGGGISIRHTKKKDERMLEAARILGAAFNSFQREEEDLRKLANKPMNATEWENFLLELFPIPVEPGRAQTMAMNRHRQLNDLRRTAPGQEDILNTFLGAFNAVTYLTSHQSTLRQGMSQTEFSLLGTGAKTNTVARNLLLAHI